MVLLFVWQNKKSAKRDKLRKTVDKGNDLLLQYHQHHCHQCCADICLFACCQRDFQCLSASCMMHGMTGFHVEEGTANPGVSLGLDLVPV